MPKRAFFVAISSENFAFELPLGVATAGREAVFIYKESV